MRAGPTSMSKIPLSLPCAVLVCPVHPATAPVASTAATIIRAVFPIRFRRLGQETRFHSGLIGDWIALGVPGRREISRWSVPICQARHMIDLAAAHAMRRQIGEAIHDLQQAEQLTPELTHAHHGARLVTRDLLQLSGLRPRPELRELA